MGAGGSVPSAATYDQMKEVYEGAAAAAAGDEAKELELFRQLKAKFAEAEAARDEDKAARSAYFARTPLSAFELPPAGGVATVSTSSTVAQAAQVLNQGNFMAAPVLRDGADPAGHWADAYAGMVDVVRLVQYVLDQVNDDAERGFEEQLSYHAVFGDTPVSAVTGSAEAMPFLPIEESASLLDAMVLLGQYHVPRVPIVDAHGELVNIVTRSSVVREAADRFAEGHEVFDSIRSKTVGELGLGARSVITVSTGDPVKSVLQAIVDAGVTGVGVVNHHGVLVGNFSARDVRHVACNPKLFLLLQTLDVGAFCRTANLGWEEGANEFLPPICVTDGDTLEHTLRLLAEKRIHRVYKVDAEGKPSGLISLTDVLMALVEEPLGFQALLQKYSGAGTGVGAAADGAAAAEGAAAEGAAAAAAAEGAAAEGAAAEGAAAE